MNCGVTHQHIPLSMHLAHFPSLMRLELIKNKVVTGTKTRFFEKVAALLIIRP